MSLHPCLDQGLKTSLRLYSKGSEDEPMEIEVDKGIPDCQL